MNKKLRSNGSYGTDLYHEKITTHIVEVTIPRDLTNQFNLGDQVKLVIHLPSRRPKTITLQAEDFIPARDDYLIAESETF